MAGLRGILTPRGGHDLCLVITERGNRVLSVQWRYGDTAGGYDIRNGFRQGGRVMGANVDAPFWLM